jgi:predicted DCC family thiol-disulfide oxidoreductase YuxK
MASQQIILFDGVCNLCNDAVQFVIKHDPAAKFKFASLQSDYGQAKLKAFNLLSNNLNSFVYLDNGQAFTASTAALKVAKQLRGPVKLLYGFIIVPRFIRDAVYKLIARNRYQWFGKKNECMVPAPSLNNRFLN